MLLSILYISIGASLGAVGRWFLGLWLNNLCAFIPIGTLVANWVACYLMGVFMGGFLIFPNVSQEMRLLILTGFLGGLSTLSTLSAELVVLFQHGKLALAGGYLIFNVGGSLILTYLGVMSVSLFKRI